VKYGVSQSWISRLVKRYRLEGEAAFEPRSRRPHTSPSRLPQPNERWQADFTHWWLAEGTHVEILDWLDDHARYAVSVTAHRRVTGPIVLAEFRKAVAIHGVPASTLTDNGMVFTTRLSGGKGGRNGFENELRRPGVTQINSTPNHPRATTIAELQTQLDAFVEAYNHHRPHRSLAHQATPATAYAARPKADPATRTDTHDRVRTDRIDQTGVVTLRVAGRLHHIGVGRTYTGTRVLILVQDLHIRILNAATGQLLRELTLDPAKDYQPTGAPKGPKRKKFRT
jgi:Integrase core domain